MSNLPKTVRLGKDSDLDNPIPKEPKAEYAKLR